MQQLQQCVFIAVTLSGKKNIYGSWLSGFRSRNVMFHFKQVVNILLRQNGRVGRNVSSLDEMLTGITSVFTFWVPPRLTFPFKCSESINDKPVACSIVSIVPTLPKNKLDLMQRIEKNTEIAVSLACQANCRLTFRPIGWHFWAQILKCSIFRLVL